MPLLFRGAGIPPSSRHGDLEAVYTGRLLEMISASDLDAVVLLANDLPRDRAGNPLLDAAWLYVPNEPVIDLARRHPEFLAGVSIHPARPDACDELDKCIEGGAVLVKLLPNCQGVDCLFPGYRRFFEKMAAAGLPLLAHTGGEFTLPVVDALLANPATLKGALDCGVTVIGAHCGTRSGLWDPDYFHTACDMMRRFPNFFCDTSALNHPVRSFAIRPLLEDRELQAKLVHGSDFPVPVVGWPAVARGVLRWRDFSRIGAAKNPLQRDLALKRAMGFDEGVFRRGGSLLRRVNAA